MPNYELFHWGMNVVVHESLSPCINESLSPCIKLKRYNDINVETIDTFDNKEHMVWTVEWTHVLQEWPHHNII